MKVCEKCEQEIFTKDGENRCQDCEQTNQKKKERNQKAAARRKATRDAMASIGLVRVRGALGGVYYE